MRSIPNPQSNRSPVKSNRIHSTLLSDLARSLRKTAFLSAKASVAAMAPTHTSNEPDRIGPSPDWNLLPRARSMGGPIDRRGRERERSGRVGGDGREGVEARRKRLKCRRWTVLPLPLSSASPLRACVASPLLVNGRNGKEASGAVDFSFHESFLGPLVSWTCGLKFRWAVTQNRFGFSAVFGILLKKKSCLWDRISRRMETWIKLGHLTKVMSLAR